MYKKVIKRLTGVLLSLILLGVMVDSGSAATYDLCAGETTKTMPDPDGPGPLVAPVVPMWGFGTPDPDTGACQDISAPGPPLVVGAAGDPTPMTLTINLTNNLPEPVSLHILGQQLDPVVTGGVDPGPVWTAGVSDAVESRGSRTNTSARVRSFSHETPPAQTATYEWVNFRPGTFLLQSGTNPAKQVQMGLYRAVKKDVAPGIAYPNNPALPGYESVPYDKELILVYSEVDPEIHTAVSQNSYGANAAGPLPHITNSLHRDPKYFLINGMAFEPAGGLDPVNAATPINPGDTVLVRFLNAGYETHVPQLLNMYMSLVAEDGNPYAYPKEQYGVQLPAGKTIDAVFTMPTTIGRFSIHDAAHHLTNNGTGAMGGMLAFVSTPPCPGDIEPVPPDKDVDGLDLYTLWQDFGRANCNSVPCPGDIAPVGEPDGMVDALDLAALAEAFGRANCP